MRRPRLDLNQRPSDSKFSRKASKGTNLVHGARSCPRSSAELAGVGDQFRDQVFRGRFRPENRLLWQLAVETPVRDLVDRLRVGVARVMPDAESEIAKRKTFAISDESEDHPELAVRRGQVDLKAGRKLRPVPPFGIAAAQSLDLDAISLELTASLPQRLSSGAAASHRVLGEGALVEEDAGMTPPDGQELPLAVCGLEWPVLDL